jgi:site-specific DNA-methyltransferase (adenine-specific)
MEQKPLNVQTVSIESLVPYWRNPRKNEIAVEKVKASIAEFGYQTPIIVDKEMVIITGHTRYRALKELGYTEIPVIVADLPQKKVKEYRIIDNRTSEYATWTSDLALELKEFSSPEFLDIFFPDIKLDPDFLKLSDGKTQDDINDVAANLEKKFEAFSQDRENEPKITIPCPNCAETITMLKRDLLNEKNWN